MSRPVANRALRGLYLILGIVSLGVGVVGIVLPLVPTAGPVLFAAYFFARSSDRLDRWLVNHRVFGPILVRWRSGEGYSVAEKAFIVTAILVSFAVSMWLVGIGWLQIVLAVVALSIAAYIVSLPTRRE